MIHGDSTGIEIGVCEKCLSVKAVNRFASFPWLDSPAA
jgi:hypothetical protein